MQIKYILRHHTEIFSHISGSLEIGLIQHMRPQHKNILFHHLEDVDNYIRNNVKADGLIKLELEIVMVE